ncbi:MAG: hypothetical protein M0P66_06660 [Salinivirgaceae bacterium]|nr:hypothetical protein [Salinivirgaceae bacterium]
MLSIPYSLAHNIVHAGLEFAEEFGFNPHKDFTQTSKYILENDDESIEWIEIECGVKGIPAFMRGPYDDEAKVKRILAQLEKSAGAGNYQYFTGHDLL